MALGTTFMKAWHLWPESMKKWRPDRLPQRGCGCVASAC